MDAKQALAMAYGYLTWIEKGEQQLSKDKSFLDLIGKNLDSALASNNIELAKALANWIDIAAEDIRKVQLGVDVATNNLRSALDAISASL